MGGDCTWTGCVPSKTLLSIAKTAHSATSHPNPGPNPDPNLTPAPTLTPNPNQAHSARTASHGISVGEVKVDMRAVKARIDSVIDKIYTADDSPEALQALGIEVSATF